MRQPFLYIFVYILKLINLFHPKIQKLLAMKTIKIVISICIITLFSTLSTSVFSQLNVTQATVPADIDHYVLDVMVAGGLYVDNIQYEGDIEGFGEFTNGNATDLAAAGDMDEGVILATGYASSIPAAFNSMEMGDYLANNGDPDLQTIISGGSTITDASVLIFDFMPTGSELTFDFIFASEEYHAYVNSSFNDVFGFFVTSLEADGYNYNSENIALIPGTTTAVEINTVNNGYFMDYTLSTGPCTNCAYFVDNYGGTTIVFNAFTTVITAQCDVEPCKKYRLKIAVGDAGDQWKDSAVFLKAGSIQTEGVSTTFEYTSDLIADNAIEGCSEAVVTFTIAEAPTSDITIHYLLQGSATNGVDFPAIPFEVTIPAGQTEATIIIDPDLDGITEGTEQLIFIILDASPCSPDTVVVNIIDNTELVPSISPDVEICDYESTDITASVLGGISPYTYEWDNGLGTGTGNSTTNTISPGLGNYGTTVYNVIFTDACGATTTESVAVTSIQCDCQTPPVPFEIVQPPCCGDNATINYTGPGLGTVSGVDLIDPIYTWNIGSATLVSGNTSGSGVPGTLVVSLPDCDASYDITLTVTNHEGVVTCSSSEHTETIVVPSLVTLSVTGTDPSCNGVCDATATSTAAGGTGSYTYSWDNGAGTNPDATGLCGGTTYTLVVTDQNGCTASDSHTPVDPPLLTLDVNGSNPTCNGVCDASATSTATGGTGTYTYSWDNGAGTNPDASGLCGGTTYTLVVTDQNGCTASDSHTPVDPPLLTLSVTGTHPSCDGYCDATASGSAGGGTGSYSYTWDNGAGNNASATDLCGGITYTLIVTDQNGCTASDSHTPVDPPGMTLSVTGTNPSCNGYCDATATATASGGTGTITFLWSNGDTGPDATGLCGGTTYTVTATDQQGCTKTDTHTPVDPPGVVLSVTGTDPSCNGVCDATATTTASGGTAPLQYAWDNNAGNNPNATDLCGDITYTVTVTDANGCTITGSHTPVEPDLLTLVVTGTHPSCAGSCDATASGTAGGGTGSLSYLWDNGAGTSPDASGLCGDITYTLVVTDQNGCTATDSHTPVEPPAIIIDQATVTDVTCYGYNDGTITVVSTGGSGSLTYSIPGNSNTQGFFAGLSGGPYTVTITDENGCSNSVNVTIYEPPQLNVTLQGDEICIGESTFLTANASGGTPGYTYTWNVTGQTGQTIMVDPDVTTYYSVLVTDSNMCTANANATIFVYPPLVISAYNDDTICPGETATLYADYYGGMGEPYTLMLNGTTQITTPYVVSPDVTTTYQICVTDECTTPQACDEVTIVVMDNPPVNFVSDIVDGCEPLKVSFTETSPHTGQTYIWDFDDPFGNTNGTGKTPVHTFDNPGTYDITCTVISSYGCVSSYTWEQMITVYPNPLASFLPYPQVANILKPEIYFENTSSTLYISNWEFGDGDTSNVTHPQHHYDTWGTFVVQLAVETEYGCVDTAWTEIVIEDVHTFYAPTSFSPDFDQINALFSPVGHGIDPDNWYLAVFDRWGEKVWETNIYDVDEETGKVNHGWNGIVKGKNIGEAAAYSWLAIYRDMTGAEHQRQGIVVLIR